MSNNIDAADRLIQDHDFRQKLRQHDTDALAQIGYDMHSDAVESPTFKVVTSTQDTTYVQMPPRPLENHKVSADELGQIQAAGTAGTIGSAGTGSTVSTLTSTASSGACVGSVGTIGSGG